MIYLRKIGIVHSYKLGYGNPYNVGDMTTYP